MNVTTTARITATRLFSEFEGRSDTSVRIRYRLPRSAKIGCRSRIHVSCYRNKLKIVRFDVKHNHDVAPEHAKAYPRNRRLTQSQLAIVGSMLQTNQDSHAIKDFIESKYNPPQKPFLRHIPHTMHHVRRTKHQG